MSDSTLFLLLAMGIVIIALLIGRFSARTITKSLPGGEEEATDRTGWIATSSAVRERLHAQADGE